MNSKKVIFRSIAFIIFTTGSFVSVALTSFKLTDKFPMIMYGVSATERNFENVRAMGIDYVHVYGLAAVPLTDDVFARIDKYLDLADKYNLKVVFDLNGNIRIPKNMLDEMRQIVRKYKNHPAMGMWYLADEPDNKNIPPKDFLSYYKMIKSESPNIPVAMCHAWTKNWYRYNNVQDILMHDLYPITGIEFPNAKLKNQTDFTRAAVAQAKGKPAIPVLQFFSVRSLANAKATNFRGYPINKLRYPNLEELRYFCFSALSQGAEGLAFYSYARSVMIDPNWSKRVGGTVLNEVKELTNIIKNDRLSHQIIADYKKDGYMLSTWSNEKEKFIILINTSNKTRSIAFQAVNGAADVNIYTRWGKTRDISMFSNNNKLTIKDAQPWEVFIWNVKN